MIGRPPSTLAELAGLGAAVLHHAAPVRHRPRVSRALHRLGDHPVTRWPAAVALAAVGAGWTALRCNGFERARKALRAVDSGSPRVHVGGSCPRLLFVQTARPTTGGRHVTRRPSHP